MGWGAPKSARVRARSGASQIVREVEGYVPFTN
jgi:hypothetical protein